MLADAKEEARDLMREAKDAAVGSLRHAKDSAINTVSETVHEIGTQARRAGGATAHFVGDNAVPLSLIGVGVAWLTWSLRQNRSSERMYSEPPGYALGEELDREWEEGLEREDYRDRHRGEPSKEVSEAGSSIRERIRPRVEEMQKRVDEVGQRARDFGRDARERLHKAEVGARDFALDNPIAIGAVAVAAGVGVGLLLPSTARENELMGEARTRMMNDGRRAAQRVAQTAKETVDEVKAVIKET